MLHALRSIIRESATNTIRHAGAGRLSIVLRATPDGIALSVSDDGCGLNGGGTGSGHGLGNIRRRIAALGGECRLGGGDNGAHLEAHIPLGNRELSV